jgi:hypothetical protein
MAQRAKRAANRRAKHERAVRPAPADPDPTWREAVAVLHEELDRLPESDRQPLILCYIEGLSRDEAARRLGWSLNKVRGQLERSRLRLRKRLQKRGIALSVGLLAAVSAEGLDPSLVVGAIAEAARPGDRIAGLVASGFAAKARLAIGLAIVGGLVAVSSLGGPPAGANSPPTKDEPKTTESKPADPPKDDQAIRGRVVDPDGKPVTGAVIWLLAFGETPREATRTEADGRFTLPHDPKNDRTRSHVGGRIRVAATKDGFGMALPPERFEARDVVLKFVKDLPVRGRILDLQGKPVAGATVTPLGVWATVDDTLDGWLKAIKAAEDAPRQVTANLFRRKADPAPVLQPVKTDADGRFTLTGVGRERLLRLKVSGPTIAATEIDVMTRDTPAVRVQYDPGNAKFGQVSYHGSTFDFAADPTQPFEGVVTAKETGEPIAKAVVRCDFPEHLETTADEKGRYRLVGLTPGEHRIVAVPPASEPYLPRLLSAGRANNEKPVKLDFALTRGVWVEGTVIDAKTKKPIARAGVDYCPLDQDALRVAAGDPAAFDDAGVWTDAEGRFKIAALPVAGGIGIHGPDRPYISAGRRRLQGDSLRTVRSVAELKAQWTRAYFNGHDALATILANPKEPHPYTFTLDRGETVTLRALDPDGKPLAGTRASRLTENNLWTMDPFPTEKLQVTQVPHESVRPVLIWHEKRQLGAVIRPKPDPEMQDVRLQPTGSARGRVLNRDGQPAADQLIEVSMKLPGEFAWGPWFPQMKVRTDAEGRFELVNLPEGADFSLRGTLKGSGAGRVYQEFRVSSGKVKELGDVKARE